MFAAPKNPLRAALIRLACMAVLVLFGAAMLAAVAAVLVRAA